MLIILKLTEYEIPITGNPIPPIPGTTSISAPIKANVPITAREIGAKKINFFIRFNRVDLKLMNYSTVTDFAKFRG